MQMQEEAGFRSSRTATTPRGIHLSECLLNKSLHVAVPKIQKDTETFVPHLPILFSLSLTYPPLLAIRRTEHSLNISPTI